jgi:hypothetical protein
LRDRVAPELLELLAQQIATFRRALACNKFEVLASAVAEVLAAENKT